MRVVFKGGIYLGAGSVTGFTVFSTTLRYFQWIYPKNSKIDFTEKILYFQNETPDSKVLTELTIYILGCLVFSFVAMMYYGVILSIFDQKTSKNQGC